MNPRFHRERYGTVVRDDEDGHGCVGMGCLFACIAIVFVAILVELASGY